MIVCNPPYHRRRSADAGLLDVDVICRDPALALFVDDTVPANSNYAQVLAQVTGNVDISGSDAGAAPTATWETVDPNIALLSPGGMLVFEASIHYAADFSIVPQ